jgi:hypothetical protein
MELVESGRAAAIDYEHYLTRQLEPVADGILPFLGDSFGRLTSRQGALFYRQRIDRVGPGQRGAFARVEEGRFAPGGDAVQVAWVGALLDQVAPVHIDADAAAVELGDAQVDQFDQARPQRALLGGVRQRDHGLQRSGGQGVQGEAGGVRHGGSFQGARLRMHPSAC